MSTIKLSRKILFLSTLFFVGIAVNTAYAQLPENHPYQKTLINYMGTLKQSDFKVDLQPLTVKASYFNSADQAYRAWLFFGHLAHSMMGTRGLRVGASNFTLSSIEANGQVNMTVGRDEFMNPIATAFWAIWDYKGNPHYGSRAVKLRAFVASAVDMIMQDQNFEQGHNKRSDFLGMQLTRWAFVYGAVKDILPAKVRTAYQKGLVKMFNRLIKWGPTGIHADMDMAATEGVLYTAKFVTIQDLTQQAHQYIQKLMNNFLKAPGYIGHGSAYDAGYNGISLYFLNWAAQISGYKPLIQALKKMSKFKAYMTLPDPDGQRYSPFQSNPSSGTDAPHDLWGPYYRDVGIAKYSNNAAYLALKGGNSTIESKSTMLKQMNHMLQYFNDPTGYLAFTGASDKTPGKWHSNHWNDTNSLNATAFYYKKGLYGRLKNIKNNQPSLTKPPFARQGTFTKNFANKYLSVKRQTYGTIIDNDRLSWWTHKGQTKTLNGFGGGNMAAFWTPKTGSVILGGTRTGHHGGLDLKDWRIWPVNALSGETADGIPFSSGLQRFPKANYALSQTPKIVTITGNLAGTYSDPRNGLQGTVTYKRVFQVKKNGVQVTTSVSTGSSNKVKDLYEILPVYRRNAYSQSSDSPTSIEFKVNGSWQQAGTTLKKVSSIRLQRFQGTVFIDFENPVMVKLSSHDFYKNPTQKHGLQARNIMIAMLKNEGQSTTLTNASVTYFLRSSKAKPNQNWSDPSQSGTSGSSSTDTTAPTVNLSHSPSTPDDTQKIDLQVNAKDSSGIQQISVFARGNKVKTCSGTQTCTATVGPYADGSYKWYATATDNYGNKKTAGKQTVKVYTAPQDTTPPTLSTSYSPHNPYSDELVTFTANAKDTSGINSIRIYINDKLQKTCKDLTKCTFKKNSFKPGTYSYYAKATDNSPNKNVKTSDSTQITVGSKPINDNPPHPVEVSLKKDNNFLKSVVKHATDPDGDKVNLNYDWRVNGNSIALINLSFDIRPNSSKRDKIIDYSSGKNGGVTGGGTAIPKWTQNGKEGGAFIFDGKNDFVKIPTSSSLEKLNKFTVEAWLKPEKGGSNWESIISKPFADSSWKSPWAIFNISRNSGTQKLKFQIAVGNNKAVSLESKHNIPDQKWTHVTGIYDGKEMKLYVNGKLDQTLHVGKKLIQNKNTNIFIGKKSAATKNAEQFKGTLDEVRLFNRVLSPDQIKQYYLGNDNVLALDQTKPGQRWSVAVTANDSKITSKTTVSNSVITSTPVQDSTRQFNHTSISQNYPNPFKSQTTIDFKLKSKGHVKITIFNILGQKISTICDKVLMEGKHSIIWNVPGTLSSGVYFCRFDTKGKVITQKMTHIK